MGRTGRLPGYLVTGVVLAMGCGGEDRQGDLPYEIVFPVMDLGGPTGEVPAGADLSDSGTRETTFSEDLLVEEEGKEVPRDFPAEGQEDGLTDVADSEGFEEDPGDGDPAPADEGNEVPGGLCRPGAADCLCQRDEDCDPAFDLPCRPNRCAFDLGRCMLDSGILEGHPCDDGDPCTTGETCRQGNCRGGVVTCECRWDAECPDDGNPCSDDRCIDGRCVHPFNEAWCEDGDGCTAGDRCLEGVCVAGPRWCECDSDARCGDGLDCTEDRCIDGVCHQELVPDSCRIDGRCWVAGETAPGEPCQVCLPFLDPRAWSLLEDGTPCSDDNPCTGPDLCREGTCRPGGMVCECIDGGMCDDGNLCTDDFCEEFLCRHLPNALPCEDGDPDTLGDFCGDGECRSGPRCGDGVCERPRETCAICPGDCGPCPAQESLCGDGWDDDLDGQTDCADPDCVWLPPCMPDTCMKVDANVSCGFRLTSHVAVGNEVTGKACGSSMIGDDTVWRFVSETTRKVTFRVEDPFGEDDVEVYVLSGACNPATCIGRDWGWWGEVTFTAEAGRPYYLVYEESTWGARTSVRVTCP